MGSLPIPTYTTNTTTDNTLLSSSQPDPSTAQLPAILCLHGGGSNETVFKIQTRRLYWRLSSRFRFVFVQGPLEGEPGWGMLPVFASLAPFHRWVSRRFKPGEGGVEATPADEVRVVDSIILRAMAEHGGRNSFVGVMGFSQGARLAAGLLLRQQLEIKHHGSSEWGFKFCVVIGGPFPPIGLMTPEDVELDYSVLRQVPTVHAWGRDDQVRQGAREMAHACDSPNTFVMDFEGAHHLPLKDSEADELCGLIVDAWHAAG
jgi:pimeloyl-ACP methyl ester carboxylesterase